jgi:hypothetical protein
LNLFVRDDPVFGFIMREEGVERSHASVLFGLTT